MRRLIKHEERSVPICKVSHQFLATLVDSCTPGVAGELRMGVPAQ